MLERYVDRITLIAMVLVLFIGYQLDIYIYIYNIKIYNIWVRVEGE